ncbi:endoplasmic reticulum mannosyl-oligosaccharide 1,2-alpha-mannosidase [Nannizzia gypsea CBS 118893]|uniref:alpha-1,2-Mannosidase n=1 Tax=Arthroderma gypseum (strain ATCC MYA-4604 / CBS 118893) TaxID=535722 RepID=E4UZW2_ARTGP|nr:endoplasmic reticulum mannosyl-oligosaccharide 1,2-alpha-mannosidase [Nannizzia gypsea CBS 118893]EFR02899.1 endoplasmic reticulum mannosyl-oligosaccharide 1,2-alpha-mannosidase [Nannizzia gypsea CBS 118893]
MAQLLARHIAMAHLKETEHMFFHGFENYMKYAFPEDELRPVSCQPLTRDRKNPAHIELNDVLGNYSLTLVDSLSTLAILSYPNSTNPNGRKAWRYFQNGVRDLVELYGDGSDGPSGIGSRSKGFEVDSKVQVFESVIRGLGGLLSAHLFAVGDLPIRGYEPPPEETEFAKLWNKPPGSEGGIEWENGFVYDGQLLRLAMDLGTRLLPAFYTPTGIPYPRVNLRNGVPFHPNSPLNSRIWDAYDINENYDEDTPVEITENCSAGAGSLVLEFTVLSRLTGDGRYEEFAKRAFWSVWDRRSELGLIGAGINAETGEWTQTYTGIGAGMDSFFEYALKSHILLSEGYPPEFNATGPFHEYDNYFLPLPYQAHSPDSFLKVWEESFEAIKNNLYRGSSYQYPHYIQGDIATGATRALWMDSLSAYFPGLLTLAGNVEAAAESHLLNTALWTRFSALPERWNVATGDIEGGLEWWGGRPEFIESTYYLYRATEDPWYLYVGEMVLRDIKRRCWTKCGWAGLQNVRRGDQSDRMESFFLGETSKYLYLLFEPYHPLNKIDSPYVYSTEGHPLVLPAMAKQTTPPRLQQEPKEHRNTSVGTCGPPAVRNPFGVSSTAARPDIFHAASLARLRLTPPRKQPESPIVEFSVDGPSVTLSDLASPSNYTYFPWTLPPSLVPRDAVSSPMAVRPTLDLTFPPLSSTVQGPPSLERVEGGILIKSFGGLRLGMIQDAPLYSGNSISSKEGFRIQVVSNIPLGKNEKVFVSRETASALSPTDPNFTQTPDTIMMDVIIDVKPDIVYRNNSSSSAASLTDQGTVISGGPVLDASTAKANDHAEKPESHKSALSSLLSHVTALIRDELQHLPSVTPPIFRRPIARFSIPAISSTGIGSAPLPEEEDATFTPPSPGSKHATTRLTWSSIYLAGHLCDKRLPPSIPRTHQIIIVKRGGCTFSDKLRNIPSFRPTRSSLQLVVVVSYPQPGDKRRQSTADDESSLIRPLLDEMQTVVGGFPRPRPISMVMVGGGDKTYEYFSHALGVGIRRRYEIQSQGIPISNLIVI